MSNWNHHASEFFALFIISENVLQLDTTQTCFFSELQIFLEILKAGIESVEIVF